MVTQIAKNLYVGDLDYKSSTFKLPIGSMYINIKQSKIYNVDVTGSLKEIISPGSGNGIKYIDDKEPENNINPDEVGVLYLDTNTFTVYICTDNTKDSNKWEVLNIGEFEKYMCETPDIEYVDEDTTEVNERDYVEIKINNYDEEATYIADNELVNRIIYKSDNIFKVYFGSVDEDTDITFAIRAFKLGYINSKWSNELDITIKDRPEEEDDAIINDAFADNEDSSSDADVTNDKITFTADGGEYKEVITEQGDTSFIDRVLEKQEEITKVIENA